MSDSVDPKGLVYEGRAGTGAAFILPSAWEKPLALGNQYAHEDNAAAARAAALKASGEAVDIFTAVQKKGLSGPGKVVYRFKGSARSIKNPWASLLDGTARAIETADRNNVLRNFRDLAVEARKNADPGTDPAQDAGTVMRNVTDQGVTDHTVKIFVDGKEEVWQFDAQVHRLSPS